MSLDLMLLPIEFDDNRHGFSHTVLGVNQGGAWYDLLKNVHLTDVPDKFNTYVAKDKDGDPAYGDTQTTPYDEPLRAARVEDILKCLEQNKVGWGRRDAAVIAYLRELEPRMKIALYWH